MRAYSYAYTYAGIGTRRYSYSSAGEIVPIVFAMHAGRVYACNRGRHRDSLTHYGETPTMSNHTDTDTDTAGYMRCISCGNPRAWWDGDVMHCEPCELQHAERVAAVRDAERTAAQHREDSYRDSMSDDEYGDALARAMQRVMTCPDTCSCRGLARAIDATVNRDPRAMRYTTLGVTR